MNLSARHLSVCFFMGILAGPAGASAAPPDEEGATGTISGSVLTRDLTAPISGATVSILETAISVSSDPQGRFELHAPAGRHTVRAEVGGFAPVDRTVTVRAGATTTVKLPLSMDDLSTETIVVVGSRTPRTNVDTPVPVDVVTSEEISRSGQLETARALSVLAPSYSTTPQTIADGSDHVAPASLRGLGPDQVLVLVNGKRRHHSALLHVNGTFGRGTVGVDLNAIPAAAIKRIEILRDGAASQYGSDAIAGVINVVLKDVTDAGEVTTAGGVTGEKDGAQLKASANYGVKLGRRGYLNVTGEFLQRQPTNRSGAYTGAVYSSDRATDDQMLQARGLTREDFAMKIGESGATVGLGSYNLEVPLADHARLYSFGGVSYRQGRAAGFYRYPFQTSQVVPEIYPDGFLPEIHTRIIDLSAGLGVRGELGAWHLDLSLTHGSNSFRFDIDHTNNASLGAASPTSFYAGTLRFRETVVDLDVLRPIQTGSLGSLSLVLGSELRLENYGIGAGEERSWSLGPETFGNPPQPKAPGAQVFPGFQPSNEVDRSRHNIGVYAGVESELVRRLILDVGGRFENYSDFGNSLIGKVATRLELARGVALRGAASTGFRAPSLPQLWFNNVSTLFVPDAAGTLAATQVLTSNNQSPVTRAFGIPDLKEEKSLQFSGGLALHPLESLALTVDGYYIRIEDRIVLTSRFTDANAAVKQILAPFPGVSQAQFFANAVDTRTVGLEAVADYALALGGGSTLALTASATFTKTVVTRVKIPQTLQDRFGADPATLRTFFFGRQEQNRLEDAVPRQRGTASARYTRGALSALVRASYYGRVYSKPDLPANDEQFGAKTLFDLDLGYQLTRNLRLALGAENLFNTFPDKQTKEANISAGRFIYSRNVSQFGQNGGFYYARAQVLLF